SRRKASVASRSGSRVPRSSRCPRPGRAGSSERPTGPRLCFASRAPSWPRTCCGGWSNAARVCWRSSPSAGRSKSCSSPPLVKPTARAQNTRIHSGEPHDHRRPRAEHVSRGGPRQGAARHRRLRLCPDVADAAPLAARAGRGCPPHRRPRTFVRDRVRHADRGDGRCESGGQGNRPPHDLQPAVAAGRAPALPGGEMDRSVRGALGGRADARRRSSGHPSVGRGHESLPAGVGRRFTGRPRADGHGVAGRAVFRALPPRASGPLPRGLLLRGQLELRPPPLRGQVPSGPGVDHRGRRRDPAQPAALQREDARGRWRVAPSLPLRLRHALRAALRRLRPESGRDRVRDARIQVSAHLRFDARTRNLLIATTLALLLGGAAVELGEHAYRTVPHPHGLEELSYYPSGEWLRPAALGHPETMADLAWIRAVQYYGEHRMSDNRFVMMGHVYDVLTTLAPGFLPAYVFGAFALAQEGGDFPSAERLM